MVDMLRVVGFVALVWIGLIVVGAVLKVLFWPLLIGAVAIAGVAGYRSLKATSESAALR